MKILDLSSQHKNLELWCLLVLIPVCCFTNRLTQTPMYSAKMSIVVLTNLIPHLILQKEKYLYKNYYKISERHVGIYVGKNKYYYIEKGTATK